MNRECVEINPIALVEKYPKGINFNNIKIYIDSENTEGIIENIKKEDPKGKKLKMILYWITKGYNNDLYGKENISDNIKKITAMKFKKGKNLRIYCKEYIEENIKRVVLMAYYYKKTQGIDKKLRDFIENLGRYEYEFE